MSPPRVATCLPILEAQVENHQQQMRTPIYSRVQFGLIGVNENEYESYIMDFLHLGVAQMSHVIIKFNLNLAHLAHGHTHSEVP